MGLVLPGPTLVLTCGGAPSDLQGIHPGRETGAESDEESDDDISTRYDEDSYDMVSADDDNDGEEDGQEDGEGNGEDEGEYEQCDQEGVEEEVHNLENRGENQEPLAATTIAPSQTVIEISGNIIGEIWRAFSDIPESGKSILLALTACIVAVWVVGFGIALWAMAQAYADGRVTVSFA